MSRNCSTPGTNSSSIWRSRRRRNQPVGGPTRPVPPPRAPHHLSASYDAAPRKGRPPGTGAWPGAAVAGHRPPVRRGSRTGHRYEPARDRGTRSDGAGRRRRTRARPGPGCGCMPEGWMPLAGAGPHLPAASCPTGEPPGTRMGLTRLAMFPRLAASLLQFVYSLFVRYGARLRKPTTPEQLYIDFDGFFAACEEQADRRLQGRPLGVIPFAGSRPELRDCRQHDGQARRGHDRHGHRGRPPTVPGDRAGPPAARSLYAHPPPYRRSGSRRAAH